MASREALGGHLADRRWMGRVLDRTWQRLPQLAGWGYPFPVNAAGEQQRAACRAPSTCAGCAAGCWLRASPCSITAPRWSCSATARPSPGPPGSITRVTGRGGSRARWCWRPVAAPSASACWARRHRRGTATCSPPSPAPSCRGWSSRLGPRSRGSRARSTGAAVSQGGLHSWRGHARPSAGRTVSPGRRGPAEGRVFAQYDQAEPECDRGSGRVSPTASCPRPQRRRPLHRALARDVALRGHGARRRRDQAPRRRLRHRRARPLRRRRRRHPRAGDRRHQRRGGDEFLLGDRVGQLGGAGSGDVRGGMAAGSRIGA